MVGWILLGILILLLIIPLGVSVKYNADGPLVRILAGPVKITVFPRPKKEKKQKKKETKPKQPAVTESEAAEDPIPAPAEPRRSVAPEPKKKPEQKEQGGSWTDFLPLVKVGLDFLTGLRRRLRVNVLELKLIMAGGDPCNLAVNYGRAWAAVGNLMPHLDRLFVIRKRDVEVECDFTASKMSVIARLDITLTLGRLLALVVVIAIRALKIFLQIKKKRKGGAVNEPDVT